jgi:hypothetical protein
VAKVNVYLARLHADEIERLRQELRDARLEQSVDMKLAEAGWARSVADARQLALAAIGVAASG